MSGLDPLFLFRRLSMPLLVLAATAASPAAGAFPGSASERAQEALAELAPTPLGALDPGGAGGPDPRGRAPLAAASWLQEVHRDIARSEHFWAPVAGGAYSAPNRSQDLRSRVTSEGIELFPRRVPADGRGAPWRLRLRTAGYGPSGSVQALGGSSLEPREDRMLRSFDAFSEWYVNDERGIEQGWTIAVPPPGPPAEILRIEIEAGGLAARVAADGLSATFVDEGGTVRIRYSGLKVWDAVGRELFAQLVPTTLGFAVELDAAGALYPITVDPLLTGPSWTTEGGQTFAFLGYRVASAGDVNGDGFDDLIVSAPLFDAGEVDEGRAFLYLGSPTGPSTVPDWIADGGQEDANFGAGAAAAGDVNGDGFGDVIVGAPGFSNGETKEGRAFLYLGSAGGLSPAAAWTAESDQAFARFGQSVASAGDVDGDGFDDVIVGAHFYTGSESDEGAAFLYLGSAGGLSPAPAWSAAGGQANAMYGACVAGAGDVNGDGFDDLIVGAPRFENGEFAEGRAFVYLGSPSGPSAAADWTFESDQEFAELGGAVAGAGDVNGDGFGDVVVGAAGFDGGHAAEGAVLLFLGSAGGLSAAPDWIGLGGQEAALLGASVCGAGDVNGDGFDDVLAGALYFDGDQVDEGAVFLYLGSASGLSPDPVWSAAGGQTASWFGWSVAGAGDVNGDGFADVLIGSPLFSGAETFEGRALLFLGQHFVDCNGNGIDDAEDIAQGTSTDVDGNGVPDECEGVGASFCVTSPNSVGAGARIHALGSTDLADGDFLLFSTGNPVDQPGLFFFGPSEAQIPFGDGFRCVTGTIQRLNPPIVTDSAGIALRPLDFSQQPEDQIAPGSTVKFQWWYRDPGAGGAGFNLSDGLSVTFQ